MQMRPGSLNYWKQDAELFAEWGVDWLKMDKCNRYPFHHLLFCRDLIVTLRDNMSQMDTARTTVRYLLQAIHV